MADFPALRLYVNGRYVESESDERFATMNPANGERLAICQQAIAAGIGRENGIDSIRHYTQLKSVFVSLAELENPFG
ncbi:MAG: hypothetical protein KJO31_08300 [Gammaproteobacteria bacterium]|nr:hypothetical protein [Gammaproteobacteria bacterium]